MRRERELGEKLKFKFLEQGRAPDENADIGQK